MTIISRSVDIDATRDQIRLYYAHPVYTAQWASCMMYLWEPSAEWPNVGATARIGVKSGGLKVLALGTTLEYDDDTLRHHFRLENETFGAPMDIRVTFDEHNGRTTVRYTADYTIPGSFLGQALDKLFVERQNARDIEQALADLKTLVEEGP